MVWYLVKLIVLLPLIALLAWGSLKLARNVQARLGGAPAGPRSVRVVETQMEHGCLHIQLELVP